MKARMSTSMVVDCSLLLMFVATRDQKQLRSVVSRKWTSVEDDDDHDTARFSFDQSIIAAHL